MYTGETENHNAQDKPGSRFSDGMLGNAAGVKHGGSEIAQNDCCAAPITNEGEGNSRRDHDLKVGDRLRGTSHCN